MSKFRADLTKKAKERRKEPVTGERWVWQELRRFRGAGLVFRREQPYGRYILDFYCSKLKLAIEIDGWSHIADGEGDIARDAWLESKGVAILRFPSPKNRKDAGEIAAIIERHCLALGWGPTNTPDER